jgi:hypothetical protein
MRFLLAAAALVAVSIPTFAQQRAFSVSAFEASCRRTTIGNQDNCARVAAHARNRYGNEVTTYQWNAAVGVIRNQLRQGK